MRQFHCVEALSPLLESPWFRPRWDFLHRCQRWHTPSPRSKESDQHLATQGVLRVGIFGSVARGDAYADSDVDCLVELTDMSSLINLIAVKQLLEEVLGCAVDVVTPRGLKADIRDVVLGEVRYAA